MIDLVPIAGMVFTLLLAAIIGGFILLFPAARRLGKLLEVQLEERRRAMERPGTAAGPQLEALRDAVESLQKDVGALSDRQQFLERLLERNERDALPAAGPESGPAGSEH